MFVFFCVARYLHRCKNLVFCFFIKGYYIDVYYLTYCSCCKNLFFIPSVILIKHGYFAKKYCCFDYYHYIYGYPQGDVNNLLFLKGLFFCKSLIYSSLLDKAFKNTMSVYVFWG